MSAFKRIAISTGGGDAPGLNAVVRAAVLAAYRRGWETYGIRDGFNGIFFPERYSDGGVFRLSYDNVRGIAHLGGTVLGTTNRGNPMRYPLKTANGVIKEVDRTDEIIEVLGKKQIDALISIGGDGSLIIAHHLAERGLEVVAVPKTIDNDLNNTLTTFGFDTAVSFATECLDRLHSTAESHQRIIVVEMMGRYAGWIALHAGISGGAHAILLPEIPFNVDRIVEKIHMRYRLGREYALVVVAEGARSLDGQRAVITPAEIGTAERLGGMGDQVARMLANQSGKETRIVVLGHLVRGGSPTSLDRLAALRFGAAAVRALEAGKSNVMVALAFPNVEYVPLAEVAGRMKSVPLDCDTLATGRDMGICFGD